MRATRGVRQLMLAILLAALAFSSVSALELDPYPGLSDDLGVEARPQHRDGFYFGVGAKRMQVSLTLDPESPLAAPEIDLNGSHPCLAFHLGYGLGPHFSMEFDLHYARPHEAADGGRVHLVQLEHLAIMRLGRPRGVQLYTAGGYGMLILVGEGGDLGEVGDFAVIGEMGLGLLTRLGGHFVLDLGYRLAIVNFEREIVDFDSTGTRSIVGEGRTHTAGLQISFEF